MPKERMHAVVGVPYTMPDGTVYHTDLAGFVDVLPEHLDAMLDYGCGDTGPVDETDAPSTPGAPAPTDGKAGA